MHREFGVEDDHPGDEGWGPVDFFYSTCFVGDSEIAREFGG